MRAGPPGRELAPLHRSCAPRDALARCPTPPAQAGPRFVPETGAPPLLSPDYELDWVSDNVDATRSTYKARLRLAMPVTATKARVYLHVAAYVEVRSSCEMWAGWVSASCGGACGEGQRIPKVGEELSQVKTVTLG